MTMKEEYTAIDMATAAADGFRDGQRAAQSAGVPDVSVMARVLSDRSADACNIDRGDNWAMYGQEYIEDVQAMLAAAHAHPAERQEQGEVQRLREALEGMLEYFPEGASDGECFAVDAARAALAASTGQEAKPS